MTDQLTQLSNFTKIVADTGDIESIRKWQPVDATTNPSLLMVAAKMPQYQHIVNAAVEYGRKHGTDAKSQLELAMDKLAVSFGAEITRIVPGVVSTEVDARLSFNTKATVARAKRLIAMYKEMGIPSDRILIKIASTWEGIRAGQLLEQEGIHVNMTLLFSMCQAIAAAEGNATLISPFVGRITDWFKKEKKVKSYPAIADPGVLSVTAIYNYYKKFGYKTIVMGASFRTKDQITELAGCDKLTIAPSLLQDLKNSNQPVTPKLTPEAAKEQPIHKIDMSEKTFRWMLNEDQMATEKLSEGIRRFAEDTRVLEKIIAAKLKVSKL